MIARIWEGRTKVEDYQAYTEFMKSRAIPDYKKTAGFKKLIFLNSLDNNVGNFTLITFWENIEAIKKFAGDDFARAKYYEEDKHFLLEFADKVTHYKVFADE